VSPGTACEFEGFTGATGEVTCNERVVIGTACCGGCGCIPVEVYFDGTYCWQGVPECKEQNLAQRMLYPHQPTTPNTSYIPPDNVPGSFLLGTGGFAGSEAMGGGAGNAGNAETSSGGNAGFGGNLASTAGGGAGNAGEASAIHAGAGSGGGAGAPITRVGDGGTGEAGAAFAP